MHDLLLPARSLRRLDDARRARECQAQLAADLEQESRAERQRFVERLGCDRPAERIVIGRSTTNGKSLWVGLGIRELLGMHGWCVGATGAGKSYLMLGCLLQVLRDGHHPVILVDLKGELANLLIEVVIPALALSPIGTDLLANLRVIRPFDRRYLPLLRISEPETGVPCEVQAQTIAASLQEALTDDLGARMDRILVRMAALAIARNDPLTVMLRWLGDPDQFARDARGSRDPLLIEYATRGFARENRTSVDALAARLDSFLFLPETRLMLGAPRCISFAECLERGVTVVDLGEPPAGAERLTRFWAGIIVGRLARAILSRPVGPETPQTWVVLEEFQEGLGRFQIEQFSRLLALARYKRAALFFVNQQPAQISAVNPVLLKLLQTNTNLVTLFRSNLEDARAFGHALPAEEIRRNGRSERLSLVEEIPRLPDRTYYLWLRQASFRAQKVRSPRLGLDGLRRSGDQLPEDLREAIRRGTVAMPRAELEAIAGDAQQRLDEGGMNRGGCDLTPGSPASEAGEYPDLG